jgi:hypothetical protein
VIVDRAKIAWAANIDQNELFAVTPHVSHRAGIANAVELRSPQNLARLRIKCAKRVATSEFLQLFRTSAKFFQSAFLATLYQAFRDAPTAYQLLHGLRETLIMGA